MPDDLTDVIADNASGPKSASGDAGSVTQHSLADLIAADKYLKGQTGVANTNRGLRFSSLVPPGAE